MHVPPDLPDANVKAASFYLLRAMSACPHCGFQTGVCALAVPAGHQWLLAGEAEGAEDTWQTADAPAVLFQIADLSPAAARRLSSVAPGYRPSVASASCASRWINHCDHCGAELQDDDLHCEPEAAFLPVSPQSASLLRLAEIHDPLQANAAGSAPGAHWLVHVTRA